METGEYEKPKQNIGNKESIARTPQEYKEKYNPQLADKRLRIVNSGWDTFVNAFFIVIVLLIIAGGIFFLFLVHDGKFQTNVSTNLSCPATQIPACPSIPACPNVNCGNTNLSCAPPIIYMNTNYTNSTGGNHS